MKPQEIENRSFEIIKSELTRPLDGEQSSVILRVIHATADFEYADILAFSGEVIPKVTAAMRSGAGIISDTNMVKAGVNKNLLNALGGSINCFTHDAQVTAAALNNNTTRSHAAMDKAAALNTPFIYAIGNAPTALMRLCELAELGRCSPIAVIGVPVGFVNVVEAKERLARSGIPYIISQGRKGGSTVAAAICNALLLKA